MADEKGPATAATGDRSAPGSPSSPDRSRDSHAVGGMDLAGVGHAGDITFRTLAYVAAFLVVMLVLFVGIFLAVIAAPSLSRNTTNFFTSTAWNVTGTTLEFGIAGLLWTTVLSSVVAMVFAVPVAVGTALLVTHYVPPRVGSTIGFVVDLLAAVPSIIFGLWGLKVLGPALAPFYTGVQHALGWIPLFGQGVQSTGNVLTASLVLAIMILPIISAMSRDVFAQTPRDHIEAALALGATKWEMIRTAVIPYGRSGVIAASMLGLGRALGETVAVMIILSQTNEGGINPSLFAGGETFASKIANNAAEFDSPSKTGAYIAAGLVLFVVTFAVNALARLVADRKAHS
jgi:phosphate transport system permease protein